MTLSAENLAKNFRCRQCGACCSVSGEVALSDAEVTAIAQFLKLDEAEFIAKYTALRQNRQGLTLIEKADQSCIMLQDNKCRINPVKPAQCRNFPLLWNYPGWEEICAGAKYLLARSD